MTVLSNGLEKTYLPLTDGLGNVRGLVDAQSGTVASEFRYDPYGVPLAVSGGNVAEACPFRFQTKYWDAETGLYYFGYRYYNPSSCKWLCRDPIQEQGGINLTAYCANDPINQHDPTGLAHRESTEGLWGNSVDWGVWVADDWWELPFVGTRNVLDSTLYCYENFAAAPLMAGLGWVAEKDDEYGVTEQWMNLSASIPGFGAPSGCATYALQRGLSFARIAVTRARQTRLINKIGSTAYQNSSSWLKPVAPANGTVVNSSMSSAGVRGAADIQIADDSFVRMDASRWDESILQLGIQKRFFEDKSRVWLTKFKYVKKVLDPVDFETILYRQDLWAAKAGEFKDGVTIRMVNNVDDAVAAGITNTRNGIPQWRITRDIPPEDLILVKRIKVKK